MQTTHVVNFKERFAGRVKSGKKRSTMRPRRKRPILPGHTLKLYTGLRTSNAKFLRTVVCKDVRSVRLFAGAIAVDRANGDGARIHRERTQAAVGIAKEDGFKDYGEMFDFFQGLYGEQPIFLELISW